MQSSNENAKNRGSPLIYPLTKSDPSIATTSDEKINIDNIVKYMKDLDISVEETVMTVDTDPDQNNDTAIVYQEPSLEYNKKLRLWMDSLPVHVQKEMEEAFDFANNLSDDELDKLIPPKQLTDTQPEKVKIMSVKHGFQPTDNAHLPPNTTVKCARKGCFNTFVVGESLKEKMTVLCNSCCTTKI